MHLPQAVFPDSCSTPAWGRLCSDVLTWWLGFFSVTDLLHWALNAFLLDVSLPRELGGPGWLIVVAAEPLARPGPSDNQYLLDVE